MMARVVVRGAGDLATGVIQALARAGFAVVALEVAQPSTIRRTVALSSAVTAGEAKVEDLIGVCSSIDSAKRLAGSRRDGRYIIPVLVDPYAASLPELRADALVDAILAKRNLGTSREMAPHTVALGPGFTAGEDVDIVIETMRGHDLGRLITSGTALPNTGVPGVVGGESAKRVLHAPAAGTARQLKQIGDIVAEGEPILDIVNEDGSSTVRARIPGLLRGLIAEGYKVKSGMKVGDVDPRADEYTNWQTISDKARSLGGAVVTALLMLGQAP